MAKIATATTRSIYEFAPGAPVTARDFSEVHAAQNYARTRPQALVNLSSGSAWRSATDVSPLMEAWDPASANGVDVPVYDGHIYIDPDYESLVVVVVSSVPATASEHVTINVTIGGYTGSVDSPETGGSLGGALRIDQLTAATSVTGTGWQEYDVSIERQSAGAWELVNLSIHAIPAVVGSLPDPTT